MSNPPHQVLVKHRPVSRVAHAHHVLSRRELHCGAVRARERVLGLEHVHPVQTLAVDVDPLAIGHDLKAVLALVERPPDWQCGPPAVRGIGRPVLRGVLHKELVRHPVGIVQREQHLGDRVVLHPPDALEAIGTLRVVARLEHLREPLVRLRDAPRPNPAAGTEVAGLRQRRQPAGERVAWLALAVCRQLEQWKGQVARLELRRVVERRHSRHLRRHGGDLPGQPRLRRGRVNFEP
mmetsp:Transcript_38656/g.99921  ORF Transcript_38656/g.99921 Transcript_38656/m.99921 type:complete len:236 (+) Transcript_38656:165-872(+)